MVRPARRKKRRATLNITSRDLYIVGRVVANLSARCRHAKKQRKCRAASVYNGCDFGPIRPSSAKETDAMTAKTTTPMFFVVIFGLVTLGLLTPAWSGESRTLALSEFRDKMAGGWIGQMAGVGWGGPTEFRWKGKIIPAAQVPTWRPEMINQFHQDDIYVEMTFLRSLELHGWDVSWKQAGLDFANSEYPLWHANRAGRDALRAGIAPPDSGHPQFNHHADDIDYQIEADYSGLICPGMPNAVIELGEKFGRIMNYGDGLYGGQFVGGMYAEAFFEDDPIKIVRAGLKCIPARSQYAEAIRDTLRWFQQFPDDWEATWKHINDKYQLNPAYRRFSCSGPTGEFNIDAKINGAYIVIGLLYGHGDIKQSIVIAMRCGQDSDCNPANAGGIIGTVLGRSGLPRDFTAKIDPAGKFSHTPYNLPKVLDVCAQLARQAVQRRGGTITKRDDGSEVLVIPVQVPKPSKFEQCWEPGPISGSRFTEQEMTRIHIVSRQKKLQKQLDKRFPGWKISQCGEDMEPGLHADVRGKKNVLVTHPRSKGVACVLSRHVTVPDRSDARLHLVVGHHPDGDWMLVVRVDGKSIERREISSKTCRNGWCELDVDLGKWVGKEVDLQLLNQPTDWRFEAGYWASIEIE